VKKKYSLPQLPRGLSVENTAPAAKYTAGAETLDAQGLLGMLQISGCPGVISPRILNVGEMAYETVVIRLSVPPSILAAFTTIKITVPL
jgi:hypothetical protein